jgi:hypothetical protein
MTPPLNGHADHPTPHSPLGHVEEWESSAIDYLEARLSPVESSAIADHLAACRSCREKLGEQQWMIQLLGAVEPVEVPRDLESRVFDRLFPASPPLPLKHSSEPGVLRRLLTSAGRRPWVPAAIAVVVVMVALAGSGDVIRSGGGADISRSDLSAPTGAAVATTATAQTEALKSSPPSSAGASLPAAELHDAAGNTVAALDVPGTDTTMVGATQTTAPQADTGNQGYAVTTVTTVTRVTADTTAVSDGGPAAGAARTSAPPVWVSVQAAAGGASAAATIEETTGLRPLAIQATPGVPIYAAMIRRGDIDMVLRRLRDAGLAVTVSDAPQEPLDPTSIQRVQEISELPYLEPVSPQGDTLSPSIGSHAGDTEPDYVLMVLSAVR